ncbi:MAG: SH3 domain-containing protein [Chloroflexi bacterium]|nr:SH3 domain-containing protein [Chloroflexota bacterium]
MKKGIIAALVLITSLLAVVTPDLGGIGVARADTTLWTAEYFNNPSLSGPAAVIRQEYTPWIDWGYNAPVPGLSADNFSVRWTSGQTFSAGTYTISVRADDGVRVSMNGTVLINEFHGATGQTYTSTFVLGAGYYTTVIEYYESSLNAFMQFSISKQGSSDPGPITSATATVTNASVLNVRSQPSPTSQVLTRIRRNETYYVVGRNASSTWWQLNVNGTIGWVNGRYVALHNASGVPVTDGSSDPGQGNQCPSGLPSRLVVGGRGRVTPGLPNNLRAQPSVWSWRVGQIPGTGVFDVINGPVCANGMAWWHVRYNGVTGWTPEGQGTTYWLEPVW